MDKTSPKGEVKFSITLSDEQKRAKELVLSQPYSFILGEAGTGKTLLAVQIALNKYFKSEINKIVITRPTVSTENNGHIPGTDKEKMEPWLVPIKSNITKVYNKPDILEKLESKGALEIVALSYFRGRTFEDAVCIVDEFQNLTREQLRMCVSRLGKNSLMIFTGDPSQIDLKDKYFSGVSDLYRLEKSQYVNIITLYENHRHPALSEVLRLLND